jgi:hypothetical protein
VNHLAFRFIDAPPHAIARLIVSFSLPSRPGRNRRKIIPAGYSFGDGRAGKIISGRVTSSGDDPRQIEEGLLPVFWAC